MDFYKKPSIGRQSNITSGKMGEEYARDFLLQKGYTFVTANYKNKVGEIDLIFIDGKYIVFVEVKARLSDKYGYPEEAITHTKRNKIRSVASIFMMNKRFQHLQPRFDTIGILGTTLTYTKDAF